ncbi:MAG: carboxypeptidase M32 [Akkermansiaceae bacterium]
MSAYQKLCEKNREVTLINNTASALGWDEETYMPAGGVTYRSEQLAWLSGKAHELATCADYLKTLENAENAASQTSTNNTEIANLRELRHQYDRATKIPQKLVEKASQASSLGRAAWMKARQSSDFSIFAPQLTNLLDIAREQAELWGYEDEPYDALLENYERGTKTSEVTAMFDSVSTDLANIAQAAVEKSATTPSHTLAGHYPIPLQQILNREMAEDIGFNFDNGRIDVTTHPFCTSLGPHDTRLTTRYLEDDFTSSVFSILHEAGHGLYDQGLITDQHGLPSGAAVSLGIHESQSRLWENHVGRSRPFWEKWLPRKQELFPHLAHLDIDTFLTAINRAEKSFIRVESDEATYDLHILLRFDIERRMLNREIEVADIPTVWNEQFEKLFGITPPDDAHGCLQDIHWSMGGLGYFATYTLGNFNAAQLYKSACAEKEIAAACDRANYAPLLSWLQENVHQKGSTLFPQKLMESATGTMTDPTFYLDHLRKRFLQ